MVNITKYLNFFAIFLLFLTGAMNLGVYVQTKDELGDKLESMRNGGASAVGLTSVFFIAFGGYKYFTRKSKKATKPIQKSNPPPVPPRLFTSEDLDKCAEPKLTSLLDSRGGEGISDDERQQIIEECKNKLLPQSRHNAAYNVGIDENQATLLQKMLGLLLGLCLATFGAFTINASIKLKNYNDDAEKKYENQHKILIGTGVTNLLFGFILIAYNFFKIVKPVKKA